MFYIDDAVTLCHTVTMYI